MYNIKFIRNREETNEKFACKCSNSRRCFPLFYATLMEHRDTLARHWNINDMYSYSTFYTQGNLEQIFNDDALLSLHGGTVTTIHPINIQQLLKSVPRSSRVLDCEFFTPPDLTTFMLHNKLFFFSMNC